MVRFEFKLPYKLQVVTQRKTLGILSIQQLRSQVPMNREQYELLDSFWGICDFSGGHIGIIAEDHVCASRSYQYTTSSRGTGT